MVKGLVDRVVQVEKDEVKVINLKRKLGDEDDEDEDSMPLGQLMKKKRKKTPKEQETDDDVVILNCSFDCSACGKQFQSDDKQKTDYCSVCTRAIQNQ